MRTEKEFPVARKGIGKPDFYKTSRVTRTILGENQRNWYYMMSETIAKDSVLVLPVYTVPANWRLYIGGACVTCDDYTNYQRVLYTIDVPGIPTLEVGEIRYLVQGVINYPDAGVIIFEAGYLLTYHVYNLDAANSHNFMGQLRGMEERI